MTSALEHLKAVAPEFGATVTEEATGRIRVRLDLVLPSGIVHPYQLIIQGSDSFALVFEDQPRQLPARCLERHINDDGSFCLSWSPGEPSEVVDEASARRYWQRLTRFLQHQEVANSLRRWPGAQNARAHGEAAEFQDKAEQLAAELGPQVAADLSRGALEVRVDRKRGMVRLELLRHGRRVARLHPGKESLITGRVRCICDQSATDFAAIESCGDHAGRVVQLTLAIYEWRTRHRGYVRKALKAGTPCCQTMDSCELKQPAFLVKTGEST